MRGIIDTVPENVLAYLLEHLPQTAPHSDWIPGQLLDSTMLSQLETEGFTGFVAFTLEQEWLGGFLLYQGKPVESWRRALGGFENRAEAYRNLQGILKLAAVRLFKLPPAVVPCIAALSVGTDLESYHATQISPPTMLAQLQERSFSGAVVLENGQIGQAWYFQKGQRLLEPPLPETFREGRLHLVTVPAQVPHSVVRQAASEASAEQRAQTEHLLRSLQDLLRHHVGDNANELLETSGFLAETNPAKLQAAILVWLEDNFDMALLEQYRREIQF
jgi:hypothetical protein